MTRMSLVLSCVLCASLCVFHTNCYAETDYWDMDCDEHDVDIDDNDFDFDADDTPSGDYDQSGTADGPLSHNGTYGVTETDDGGISVDFEMTCDDHDTDVTIDIDGEGNVSVTDNAAGGMPASSDPEVTGSGTSSDPYSVTWTGGDGETHTFEWHPECKKKKKKSLDAFQRYESSRFEDPLFAN